MARNRVNVPKKRRNHLPLRLNLLFFIVFILFATLIFRLGVVQIVNGELIAREVQKTESSKIKYEVPRGKIYDRNGQVLADTISNYSVMYRRSQVTKADERLDVALKLAEILDVPEKDRKVTERDRKDYWIAIDPERSYNESERYSPTCPRKSGRRYRIRTSTNYCSIQSRMKRLRLMMRQKRLSPSNITWSRATLSTRS